MLKLALITPSTLVFPDYSENANDIIFAVDASLNSWREVLVQLVKGKRHLSRYKGEIWSNAKKNYNATKQKY